MRLMAKKVRFPDRPQFNITVRGKERINQKRRGEKSVKDRGESVKDRRGDCRGAEGVGEKRIA